MKNIDILNIATLFDFEHAINLLFKVSKQTRRLIISRIDFLNYMIPRTIPTHKFNTKKAVTLYYDDIPQLYFSPKLAQSIIHSSVINIKPSRNCENLSILNNTPIYTRVRAINIYVEELCTMRAIMQLAKIQFPFNSIKIQLVNSIPAVLSFEYNPQVFEIGIDSQLIMPIELIKQIYQVNIYVKDLQFNIKFQGKGKIGKNVWIKFGDAQKSSVTKFANDYHSFIDFEYCNFIANTDQFSVQFAEKILSSLKHKYTQLIGLIHIKVMQSFPLHNINFAYQQFNYDNFSISDATICKPMEYYPYDRCIRVQNLNIDYSQEVSISYSKIIVDKKLTLPNWVSMLNLKVILDKIQSLPNSIEIHITSEMQFHEASTLVKYFHKRIKDLKRLKIKLKVNVLAKQAEIKKLYDAISMFKELELLDAPAISGYYQNILFLQQAIDQNRYIKKAKICIFNAKSNPTFTNQVKTTIRNQIFNRQRDVQLDFYFIN